MHSGSSVLTSKRHASSICEQTLLQRIVGYSTDSCVDSPAFLHCWKNGQHGRAHEAKLVKAGRPPEFHEQHKMALSLRFVWKMSLLNCVTCRAQQRHFLQPVLLKKTFSANLFKNQKRNLKINYADLTASQWSSFKRGKILSHHFAAPVVRNLTVVICTNWS